MMKNIALAVMGMALVVCMNTSLVCASEETQQYYDANIRSERLGNYEFNVMAKEKPSLEVLPIISSDYFKANEAKFLSEVENTPPSATYKSKPIAKVDVVFAIGKYAQTGALKSYTQTFKNRLNSAGNNIDARVQELESSFDSEFMMHTTWNTRSDMDTHIYMYDAYGRELEHIWYMNRSGNGLYLNRDDTGGNNSGYEDSVDYGSPGEWFTLDFPNLPSNATKIDVGIVQYRGHATTTVTLTDKLAHKVVTKSRVTGGGHIGSLVRTGTDSWDFVKSNGEVFTGSNAVPLGETLKEAYWRDGAIRFIVNITDDVPKELFDKGSAGYQTTVSKLLDSNAYLINVGSSYNRYYLDELLGVITGADGESKGTFMYSGDVPSTFNSVGDWVINKTRGLAKSTDWILVDTPIAWQTEYRDNEKDLPLNFGANKDDSLIAEKWNVSLTHNYRGNDVMAEKWRFRHEPSFYDNSTAIASFNEAWLGAPVTVFDEAGKYRVNYKRKDNPMNPDWSENSLFNNYRYFSSDYDTLTQGGN